MAFSGALTLTDLNDYITPSQACIKPIEQIGGSSNNTPEPGAASTQIRIDSSGSYYEVSNNTATSTPSRKLEQAQISLNDCLACSGCITSAESVLITLQSHTEVLTVLSKNPPPSSPDHRIPVLSISPQSLASLAATVSSTSGSPVTLRQILYRVRAFCQQELGFFRIYDTTFSRQIALLEHVREFQERKEADAMNVNAAEKGLPMLASACPGWVCYAEKTHAEMLPFISRTKSPQQVMGTLVKNWLGQKWGKTPDKVYHVTVMPCYDKKLEASRQDFYNDLYATRDVDCVLTTGELDIMMKERGWDLSIPVRSETERDSDVEASSTDIPELITHPGTSSGSYLHSLLAAYSTPTTELTTKLLRSADYEEFTLTDTETGKVVFKGAKCYGFRNLQNLVRKVGKEAGVQVGRGAAGRLRGATGRGIAVRLKKGVRENADGAEVDKKYDYVEVMACPSGCVNGGGQLKPPTTETSVPSTTTTTTINDTLDMSSIQQENAGLAALTAKWGDKEWVKKVEQTYWHSLPTPPDSPPPTRAGTLVVEETSQTFSAARCPPSALSNVDANSLALRILTEMCYPNSATSPLLTSAMSEAQSQPQPELQPQRQPQPSPASASPSQNAWPTRLSDTAEALRRRYFRTQYRAVESEVVGIQVKW